MSPLFYSICMLFLDIIPLTRPSRYPTKPTQCQKNLFSQPKLNICTTIIHPNYPPPPPPPSTTSLQPSRNFFLFIPSFLPFLYSSIFFPRKERKAHAHAHAHTKEKVGWGGQQYRMSKLKGIIELASVGIEKQVCYITILYIF